MLHLRINFSQTLSQIVLKSFDAEFRFERHLDLKLTSCTSQKSI